MSGRVGSAKSKSTKSLSLADLLISLEKRGMCTLGQVRNVKGNCVKLTPLAVEGKRPPTGYNVFTRELSKSDIEISDLRKTAARYWKGMTDAEKAVYKAKAAKLKPPKVCLEGKEMNKATGRCRIPCADGKKRNPTGNCVNKSRKAPTKAPREPKPCSGGKERNEKGNCVNSEMLNICLALVRSRGPVKGSGEEPLNAAELKEVALAWFSRLSKNSKTREADLAAMQVETLVRKGFKLFQCELIKLGNIDARSALHASEQWDQLSYAVRDAYVAKATKGEWITHTGNIHDRNFFLNRSNPWNAVLIHR